MIRDIALHGGPRYPVSRAPSTEASFPRKRTSVREKWNLEKCTQILDCFGSCTALQRRIGGTPMTKRGELSAMTTCGTCLLHPPRLYEATRWSRQSRSFKTIWKILLFKFISSLLFFDANNSFSFQKQYPLFPDTRALARKWRCLDRVLFLQPLIIGQCMTPTWSRLGYKVPNRV